MHLPYRWQATLVVALGLLMAILDTTIVSVVLPQIATAFHTDFQTITWVGTGYFLEGLSSLTTGEILISQGLATAVGLAISGRLYNRVGPRILAVVGVAIVAVATIGFTRLEVTTTGADLQPWLILHGLGLGLVVQPVQTLAVSVVSNKLIAKASSLINSTRLVFGAVGVSVLTCASYVGYPFQKWMILLFISAVSRSCGMKSVYELSYVRYSTTDIRICYTASIAIAIRKRLLVLSVGLTERPKTRRRDAARCREQEST